MKTNIFDKNGEKLKEIELPVIFSTQIREDVILKTYLSQLRKQPYAPDLYAGMKYSAAGIISHQRRKWKTGYGIGISRIPRKIMLRRGSRFFWVGATVVGTRGGRRAHPPKIESHLNLNKINKKEKVLALKSAIASTGSIKSVQKKYPRFKPEIKVPLVFSSEIVKSKPKDIKEVLRKLLKNNYIIAERETKIRAGRGKSRGRKNKKTRGILIVIGNNEKLKCKNLDIVNANNISLNDVASGGIPGRLTAYTENALNDLNMRFSDKK
jgi:large subunit ribosomal protein L4e